MPPISKAEFARRRNVSPGRVSQWISEGKISGAALVGEGRSAQIDEEIAVRQLGEKLNVDQRHGNGLGTNLEPPDVALPSASAPLGTTLERQVLEQRLEQLQRANRQKATEETISNGQLCDVQDARRATAREVAQLVNRLEGSLTELASALAAEFKLQQRDVLHLLRAEWRKVRAAAAIEARERAEPLPETVGFELADHAP